MQKAWTTIACLVLAAIVARAQEQSAAKVLSDLELKAMLTTWTDPASGTRYVLSATATAREQLLPQDLKKGKIPYRITAALYAFGKGQKYPKMEEGTAVMYLTDASGRPVESKEVSLAKMCPS
jgi:hypothetical protein